MVETIAQALKVPYVAVALRHGSELHTAAAFGRPSTDLVRLPLVYQGEDIGELALAQHRRSGRIFSKADMDLLRSIAHEAGMAAHSVQLTADLQRSRSVSLRPRRGAPPPATRLARRPGSCARRAHAQTGRRPQPPDRRSRSGGTSCWLI